MTGFSQSALLQALGWATLNSFWQVGVFWCAYILVRRMVVIKASQHYGVAVVALLLSFCTFLGSIVFYYFGQTPFVGPFAGIGKGGAQWFNTILTAASVTYLLLLGIPGYKMVANWQFLRRLRRSQLAKAPVQYRLYVQRIAEQLGIRKKVKVYFSALVQSPVTIGYLKPLILLPVASFNQLTVQQAEAILLHELAHIRRFDYLINIGISIIHTLLYFNPFVRLFVRVAENGREGCCDAMVLQFGYDRISYASALLHLEKEAAPLPHFAMGATGKNQLLTRIETIVGFPAKIPTLKVQHFTGLIASLFAIMALHSLFVFGEKEAVSDHSQTLAQFGNPFSLADPENQAVAQTDVQETKKASPMATSSKTYAAYPLQLVVPPPPPVDPGPEIIQVAQQEVAMEQLKHEEQSQVLAAIATTREALATLEWKEMEKAMADGLTAAEKQKAFDQYQKEIEAINWKQMETNLAQQYHQTNWEQVNVFLNSARYKLHLDSIEVTYNKTLSQLDELSKVKGLIALPDQPAEAIKELRLQLKQVSDSVKAIQQRPVVRF